MKGSQSSRKKAEGFQEIAKAEVILLADMSEAIKRVVTAGDAIAIPVVDRLSSAVVSAGTNAETMIKESAVTMLSLTKQWKDRPGFESPEYVSLFEETEKAIGALTNAEFSRPALEQHSGLDEDLSDETTSAFTAALVGVIEMKNKFIHKLANIAGEYSTSDTSAVYNNIGRGFESFTNSIGVAMDETKAELAKFNINVDEATSLIQKSAASVAEAGSKMRAAMQRDKY